MVYGSCKDAFHPIIPIHERVQFYLSSKRERANLEGLSKVLTAHSNMGGMLTHVISITQMTWLCRFVLQCLVSSSMDFCPVVSVESKYGQWRRSYARAWDASFPHSRISLVFFMATRSVRALEDHIAWSSRTSLATLMSGARASSSCSTNTWLQGLFFIPCFLFSSFCCSSVSVFTCARASRNVLPCMEKISYH